LKGFALRLLSLINGHRSFNQPSGPAEIPTLEQKLETFPRDVNRGQKGWDVIVTNAATRVAYNIVRSLARSGLKVGVGVDLNSGMAAYSRYCGGTFRHPSSEVDPLAFVAAVRGAILVHRPAVYIPADEDVFIVAEHAHLLRDLPVKMAVAPTEVLVRLDNKHESIVLANSLGIPTPATIRPGNLAEILAFARAHPGSLILKTLRSSGARGVFHLGERSLEADLAVALEQSGKGFGDFIVQEFVQATGYGVSMLFDHGELKASFTHRRLRERSLAGGPSTLRQSVHQPVLEAQAALLLSHVGYHGVAMVEFKCDEVSGKTWFIEVNPRWWGSLALAIRAGVDFPVLLHRMALGEKLPPPPDYTSGVTVRWLLGDLLAFKNHLVSEKRLPGYRHLIVRVDGYDDAYADDPLPLAAELALRVMKGVRAKRQVRAKGAK
jgi:predicted ATP-grasp superfamily ATP-dependent carboligase